MYNGSYESYLAEAKSSGVVDPFSKEEWERGDVTIGGTVLKDSGARTTFDSGAMREIVEDKGRCDLLPLKQIAEFYEQGSKNQTLTRILGYFDNYIRNGHQQDLYDILFLFIGDYYKADYETAFLELAKHYQDGAKKYADRNWEKGLPLHSFIDSGIRHYLKFLRGDKDEPHDRAFIWNVIGAIWTQENHPECIDLPFNEVETVLYADDQKAVSIPKAK